jgi:hypothetical protein
MWIFWLPTFAPSLRLPFAGFNTYAAIAFKRLLEKKTAVGCHVMSCFARNCCRRTAYTNKLNRLGTNGFRVGVQWRLLASCKRYHP